MRTKSSCPPRYTEVTNWRPVLPSSQCAQSVPAELGRLILNLQHELGELSIATVKFQLNEHEKRRNKGRSGAVTGTASLFDTVASKVRDLISVDETNFDALEQLEDSVLQRALGKWHKLPYPAWRALQNRRSTTQLQRQDKTREPDSKRRNQASDPSLDEDVDEWIIEHERAVRDEMYHQDRMSKEQRWNIGAGLIRLSAHADTVFTSSTLTAKARKIVREEVDGFKVLDAKRAPFIYIQPSVMAYARTFETETRGIFKGLDWSNVVVAGGMALGTLLCVDGGPDSPTEREQWKDSDIDVYIYGLGPTAANEKIRHIYETFKTNLPEGQETLVVRNSKTISIFSQYPTKRVQIILKIVRHPKEVLLNFDLDICAVAYDGSEVWMLPRAARALETGYNVFTMDMVQGHYLGDRRATQEQRVFKYATRGYGIRFLPSYVTFYHNSLSPEEPDRYTSRVPSLRTLDHLSDRGGRWTRRAMKALKDWPPGPPDGVYVISHAIIDMKHQRTWEPTARTCLSGFELFMRHVVLWEGDVQGHWKINQDQWSSSVYPDNVGGYDDTPKYQWGPSFKFVDFEDAIDSYNEALISKFQEDLEASNSHHLPIFKFCKSLFLYITTIFAEDTIKYLARMRHGETANGMLQSAGDLLIPLVLPESFVTFAQETMNAAFQDHDIPETAENLLNIIEQSPADGDVIVLWRISPLSMWQQVDRRLDEVNELLWTFQRCGCERNDREGLRSATVCMQISRRSVRIERHDELKAFHDWAFRKPEAHFSLDATMYGMKWSSDTEEDKEYEEQEEHDQQPE